MSASDIRTVKGSYTFYGDTHHSPLDCREQALKGARYDALRREFGSMSTQSITQHNISDNNRESTYFDELSITEVNGEWIADISEPIFETITRPDGCLAVRCTVHGKAKRVSNEAVNFDVTTLRNGTAPNCAATQYNSGDDFFLRLRTPIDGYAAVYLIDAERKVFRLLPYQSATVGAARIREGRDYILFAPDLADNSLGPADELVITASRPVELNRIFVIFSPNEFYKAVDNAFGNVLPSSLSYTEFSRWLLRVRHKDSHMGVKTISIEIRENNNH